MTETTGRRRATATAVGLGILLGLNVMFAGCSGAAPEIMAEDEPPIRVRGGSIEIDLLGGGFSFEEDTQKDRKNWKIKRDPSRGRSEYTVALVSAAIGCASQVFDTSRLEVVYSDGQTIVFSAGSATKIKATRTELTQRGDRQLVHGANGYISAIRKGDPGVDVCTFKAAETSLRVYLLD